MKVILISGKANHGKDTVAQIMAEHFENDGKSVLITHYADLLKFVCTNYFGWNGVKDEDGRKMMQYIGTDVIRKQNPNMWVGFVATMLKYFRGNWEYVIIPDCRFKNEISFMVENGFDTMHVRVVRNNSGSPLTEEQKKHSSETSLDTVAPDYYIHNNGTLDDLKKLVNDLIKENLYENK